MKLSDLMDLEVNRLESELQSRDAEIEKLKKVSDMKSAIVEGMRRVCAIARMVNNQRPDVRMTAAFESYDISKLNNSHRAEIEKRDKLLEQAKEHVKEAKRVYASETSNTHYNMKDAEQWLKQYEELKK